MKKIPLVGAGSKGKYAIVDDEDYDYLSQWEWRLSSGYAKRFVNLPKLDGGWEMLWIGIHHQLLHVPQGMEVDHINGNRLDNRRANLRICTRQENMRNRKTFRKNSTGYKGVSKRGNRYYAQINDGHKNLFLGSFETAEEAAREYDKAAKELFGQFAYLNFPA